MRILSTNEVLSLLNISRPVLMRLAHRGEIPCQRVGRNWKFREDLLLEFLAGKDFTTEKPELASQANGSR